MENEAHEARGRWPLLGIIDPRKVEVNATKRSPGPTPAASAATPGIADTGRARGPASDAAPSPGGGPPQRDRSQAALRRSAPLFTRSPRRDMAQALDKPVPAAPESDAFRFSPPPGEQAGPEEVAPPVSDEAVMAPLAKSEAVAAPRNVGVSPLAPLSTNIPPTAAAPAGSLASSARPAPAARVPATAPDGAPLRKLFGAASALDVPEAQRHATSAHPVDAEGRLDRLFGRLRESGSTNNTSTTGNTKPAQGGGADSKSARAPTRPGLSRE